MIFLFSAIILLAIGIFLVIMSANKVYHFILKTFDIDRIISSPNTEEKKWKRYTKIKYILTRLYTIDSDAVFAFFGAFVIAILLWAASFAISGAIFGENIGLETANKYMVEKVSYADTMAEQKIEGTNFYIYEGRLLESVSDYFKPAFPDYTITKKPSSKSYIYEVIFYEKPASVFVPKKYKGAIIVQLYKE